MAQHDEAGRQHAKPALRSGFLFQRAVGVSSLSGET